MAYPILTDVFRCQVLLKSATGLEEDTCVNNFYFRNDAVDGPVQDPAPAIEAMLNEFYSGTDGGALNTVNSFISNDVTSVEYVLYDLGAAPPRYPVDRRAASWTGSAASRLPRETACVLSFYSGQGPRRRGRVYIGPLGSNAGDEVAGHLRIVSTLRDALAKQAENMRQSSQNATWLTVSPTAGESHEVRGGWVDNAFDTQRSRGLSATMRNTWGQPKS